MRIDYDVEIRMDDGVLLRADVFRPDGEAPVPAIVTYGPYGKGLHFEDGYPTAYKHLTTNHPEVLMGTSGAHLNWETADPEKWVPDGYACVRIDSRGAGRSEGRISVWSAREARDFHDCIEFIAAQPWCNGKVGISGVSYYASNAWSVASLQPPHLAAMCVWEGGADFYRDFSYTGGIRNTFLLNWYGMQVKTVQHGVGDRGFRSRVTGETVAGPETLDEDVLEAMRENFPAEMRAHPLDDDWHRCHSPDWSKVTVPFLSAGNWGGQGFHLRGNSEAFTRAASSQKWLELHIREHWTDFYTDYGLDLQKRFFGQFLKGEDTGWLQLPPVQMLARRVDGGAEPRSSATWPPQEAEWATLHLDASRTALRSEPSAEGAAAFEALGEGLTFMTAPLAEEIEICGHVVLELSVSSSTTDADLFVVLGAVDPDGKAVLFSGTGDPHTPPAQGWLRASHRKLDPALTLPHRPYHAHDEVQPLEPGKVYPLDIEIWPTSLIVPAGYRIVLNVLGRDFDYGGPGVPMSNFVQPMRGCGPCLHDDPEDRPDAIYGGVTTVHTGGANRSVLRLPLLKGAGSLG
jgi:uncharacterized protein